MKEFGSKLWLVLKKAALVMGILLLGQVPVQDKTLGAHLLTGTVWTLTWLEKEVEKSPAWVSLASNVQLSQWIKPWGLAWKEKRSVESQDESENIQSVDKEALKSLLSQ